MPLQEVVKQELKSLGPGSRFRSAGTRFTATCPSRAKREPGPRLYSRPSAASRDAAPACPSGTGWLHALERDDFSSNRHPVPASCFEHDLFRKPASTFRDHALHSSSRGVGLVRSAAKVACVLALSLAMLPGDSRVVRAASEAPAAARSAAESVYAAAPPRLLQIRTLVAEAGRQASIG